MKAHIDQDLCTGCGLCSDTCPEVFEIEDDIAKVLMEEIPDDAADTCREATDNCPVEAITLEE